MTIGILIESDDNSCPKTREVVHDYDFGYSDVSQRFTFNKGNLLIETRYKEEKPIKLKMETPDIHDYYHVMFNFMQELWKAYPDLKDEDGWVSYRRAIRKSVLYKQVPIFNWDALSKYIFLDSPG